MLKNIIRILVAFSLVGMISGCGKEGNKSLKVGAKPFSESMILAEMVAQTAENAGITVERNIPYGTTQKMMEAIKQGVIDIYPEYNGTSLIFLGQAPTSDGQASSEAVQRLFEPLGLQMAGKFGFSNDYAMVMTAEKAKSWGITNISELAELTAPVRFAVDEDFVQRPADGLPQLNRRYGITGSSVETFPLGSEGKDQIISALLDDQADVGELFMTDGQIAEYGLVVLKDDLNFFPIYEAVPLLRTQALTDIPELKDVLDKLTGAISASEMQTMNKSVDLDAQTAASVARSFLVSKEILPEGAETTNVDSLQIAVDPSIQRSSVTARALRAIRSGFSGNDLKLANYSDPIAAVSVGDARVGIVGAEAFYTLGEDGLTRKTGAEAFAVLGYKSAHLITKQYGGPQSLRDMQRIITQPVGSTSDSVLRMILYSLGLADSVEVVNSDKNLGILSQTLTNDQVDGIFIMAPIGDREVSAILKSSGHRLLPLDEWAEGGHTALFSFIRPATISASSYPGQSGSIASVSTQMVLAGAGETVQSAGEVGPGTAGTGERTAQPISAEEVAKIRESLNSGEILDPAMPVHGSLIPEIEIVDKSLPFSLDISLVNILMILFTVWVLYLCSLPSPRNLTLPSDND